MSALAEVIPASSALTLPPRRRYQSGVRPERYVATVVMTVVGTLALALWVGGYAQTTVAGYRLAGLQAELGRLQQANRSLAEKSAILSESTRVSTDAPRLLMVRADPARTLYVNTLAETPASGIPWMGRPPVTNRRPVMAMALRTGL